MTEYMNKFTQQREEEDDERHYRAWRALKSSKELRLQIRDAMGRRFTLPYASVVMVQYMRPSKLTIFCNHCIIHITGENLDELDAFLQDEKVRYLQVLFLFGFFESILNQGCI